MLFGLFLDENSYKLLPLVRTNYLFKVKLVFPKKSEKQWYSWLRTPKLSSCKVSGERSVKKGTLIEAKNIPRSILVWWGGKIANHKSSDKRNGGFIEGVAKMNRTKSFLKNVLWRCHALLWQWLRANIENREPYVPCCILNCWLKQLSYNFKKEIYKRMIHKSMCLQNFGNLVSYSTYIWPIVCHLRYATLLIVQYLIITK